MTTIQTQLGNLFYCIAAADDTLTSTSLHLLQKTVNDEWFLNNNQPQYSHPADNQIAQILFNSII
jgi:hypothetical protein